MDLIRRLSLVPLQKLDWVNLVGVLAVGVVAASVGWATYGLVILRPLAFPQDERLVQVWLRSPSRGWDKVPLSWDEARGLSDTALFEYVAAYRVSEVSIWNGTKAARGRSATMNADAVVVFGVPILHGRTFDDDSDRIGGPKSVLISESLAVELFGTSAAAVGRTILVDGLEAELVGVYSRLKPPVAGRDVQVLLPLSVGFRGNTTVREWLVTARLGRHFQLAEAVHGLSSRFVSTQVDAAGNDEAPYLVPLRTEELGYVAPKFSLIAIASGAFLLLVVVNASALVAAATIRGRRQVGFRLAVGATPLRVWCEGIGQAVVIGLAVCVVAPPIALTCVDWLVSAGPPEVQLLARSEFSLVAVGMSCLLAVGLSIILFGLGLAKIVNKPILELIDGFTRGTGSAPSGQHWLWTLALQTALSVALLYTATAALRSLYTAATTHPGIDAANVVAADFAVLPTGTSSTEGRQRSLIALYDRAAKYPGTAMVALTNAAPFAGRRSERFVRISGLPSHPPADAVVALRLVTTSYFRTLGIAVLRGPAPEQAFRGAGLYVNEAFVRQYVEPDDPLGGVTLTIGLPTPGGDEVSDSIAGTIVGVVGDSRYWDLRTEPMPEVYADIMQHPHAISGTVLARIDGVRPPNYQRFADYLSELDPAQPIYRGRLLQNDIQATLGTERFNTLLYGGLAAASLFVMLVGLIGVTASSVATRQSEYALRLAVGATGSKLVSSALQRHLAPVAVGCGVGILLSAFAGQWLRANVFSTDWNDLLMSVAIAAIVLFAAAGTAFLPARRIAHIGPGELLRSQQ